MTQRIFIIFSYIFIEPGEHAIVRLRIYRYIRSFSFACMVVFDFGGMWITKQLRYLPRPDRQYFRGKGDFS